MKLAFFFICKHTVVKNAMTISTVSCHQPDSCSGANGLPTASFAQSGQKSTQRSKECLSITMKIVLTSQTPGKVLEAHQGSVENTLITAALNTC